MLILRRVSLSVCVYFHVSRYYSCVCVSLCVCVCGKVHARKLYYMGSIDNRGGDRRAYTCADFFQYRSCQIVSMASKCVHASIYALDSASPLVLKLYIYIDIQYLNNIIYVWKSGCFRIVPCWYRTIPMCHQQFLYLFRMHAVEQKHINTYIAIDAHVNSEKHSVILNCRLVVWRP